jgi:pyruvate kinase
MEKQRFNHKLSANDPHALLAALLELREEVYKEGEAVFARWQSCIQRKSFAPSALNLAYYLAFRRRDLRALQVALRPWGLSSLGRVENRVIPNLDAIIATLGVLSGEAIDNLPQRPDIKHFFRGERLLRRATEDVFGKSASTSRRVRIMVTLPSEAAKNYKFVRDLVERGTEVARINCAHDTVDEWQRMIDHVHRASAEIGHTCKIHMDLGGPKARTEEVITPEKNRLHVGDRLLLTRQTPVPSKEFDFQARCGIPEAIDQLEIGANVWINDGKLGTKVERTCPAGVVLRVFQSSEKGEKLKQDKGLNFPDHLMKFDPLTTDDLQNLDFIAAHADIVGYSFVQQSEDIDRLQEELDRRIPDGHDIAIIAKIETRMAVRNLPELIVHAAGKRPFGVMIARGDLAVEIGYQRLVEMQEEILWLCEAAHVPVIWATQVLEGLVKNGNPTRAEMTDAAMAERAECVMLNKGPYIAEAVTILDDVLTRMQAHMSKKTPRLRALHSW